VKWVTWNQAAVIALASGVIAISARQLPHSRFRAAVVASAQELALMASLYTIGDWHEISHSNSPKGRSSARVRSIDYSEISGFRLSYRSSISS